jgi:cyclopropane-fatty-acyl-phospholipid synthase
MGNIDGRLRAASRDQTGELWPARLPHGAGLAAPAAASSFDRWALDRIRRLVASAPIRFELWDGYGIGPSAPVATIRFKSRRALLEWLWDPELNFGESYMFGAIEVRGDLLALLEAIYRNFQTPRFKLPSSFTRRNDRDAARSNVHHHYDLGNDFYRLWLDDEMLYTCAYFPTPAASLEAAQIAKMDLVCRKLHIGGGDRVIEAGCGWGSLALFMARACGARVRAFNLSAEQVAYARDRAAREGLTDRVEFIEDDYRNVSGSAEVFVSVGMLEHVGKPDYGTFGNVLDRTLARDGRALLHFIGRNRPQPLNAWIRKRIFPGAYPPALREVFEDILEPHAFSVLDVENLRLHYAKTLEHWRERFDRSADRVRAMFDEPFVRAWTLYLAGSQAAFTTGSLQLFQVVLARGASNALPWTRVSG